MFKRIRKTLMIKVMGKKISRSEKFLIPKRELKKQKIIKNQMKLIYSNFLEKNIKIK
jgi:hypothetical protein